MPKEISENTRSEVISYLISGKSYPEISKITGVSTSSISNIVKDLEKSFGRDDIDLLINFAKSLKKEQLAVTDALNGLRIHSILKKLNCDEQFTREFLNKTISQCKSQNLSPDKLVEYSMKFFDLSHSSKIPPHQLESHHSLLIQENKQLDESLAQLVKDAKDAKTRLDESLHHENTTVQLLNDYSTVKKRLGEFSIDIGDLNSLVAMLQESSRLDFDPHKIIQYIKKAESLETQLSTLDENTTTQTSKLAQKQNELNQIQSDIDELKLQKSQLTAQNNSLQEQISFSRNTTISAINDIKNSSMSAIDLSAKSAKDTITSVTDTSQKEMKYITDIAKNNFEGITIKFESLLSKVSDASTEIGKMQALLPLYQMITSLKGESIPVYVSVLSMLDSLIIWEKTHPAPIGVLHHIIQIQNLLREYLGKH